jgi:hypothetical protein
VCAATGLEFLHEKAQPHCGIKASNIFLFDSDVAKIGGLRVSRQADDYSDNLTLDRLYNPLDSGYDAYEYATNVHCCHIPPIGLGKYMYSPTFFFLLT